MFLVLNMVVYIVLLDIITHTWVVVVVAIITTKAMVYICLMAMEWDTPGT